MVRRARASQVVRGERTDGTKHTCHPRAPRGRLGSCLSPVASLRLRRCACSVPRARVRARSFSRSVSSSLRTKQIERARYHTNLGTRSVAACSGHVPRSTLRCGHSRTHTPAAYTGCTRATTSARSRAHLALARLPHRGWSARAGLKRRPSRPQTNPRARTCARARTRARARPSRIGLARARTRERARERTENTVSERAADMKLRCARARALARARAQIRKCWLRARAAVQLWTCVQL